MTHRIRRLACSFALGSLLTLSLGLSLMLGGCSAPEADSIASGFSRWQDVLAEAHG